MSKKGGAILLCISLAAILLSVIALVFVAKPTGQAEADKKETGLQLQRQAAADPFMDGELYEILRRCLPAAQ